MLAHLKTFSSSRPSPTTGWPRRVAEGSGAIVRPSTRRILGRDRGNGVAHDLAAVQGPHNTQPLRAGERRGRHGAGSRRTCPRGSQSCAACGRV
jgi:hypothetical protein